MVYEMYVDDGITIDEIDALSGTLSIEKMNSKINGTNTLPNILSIKVLMI